MDYYQPMLRFNRFPLLLLLLCALNANAQTPADKVTLAAPSALSSELFYQLLLGELDARSGEPGAAYSLILDAARKTNDAKLYQRAVDIALQAHSGDSALLAARAWKKALPTSRAANQYVLQILIGLNRIGETLEPLKRELATTNPKDRAIAIAALPRYFARATDKKLAVAMVEQALTDYLTLPDAGVAAWSVIGRMRFAAGEANRAMEAVRKAQAIDAKAQAPALLALSMMSSDLPQAEAFVKKYLADEPQSDLQMEYARALLQAQRYADAATQLQAITSEMPGFAEAWLLRGVLELQDGKLSEAEQSLQRYVALAKSTKDTASTEKFERGLTQAYLTLAQIAEQRKNYAQADAWLQRVDSAGDLLNAQLRRAALLARQGKLEDARHLIQSQPENSPADARLKISAEVQLLHTSKQHQQAYEILTQACALYPNDFDLVYELAMAAEKLGNLEEMERLLRKVIAGQPESSQAYNALGYSLAEHNIRLTEARQLILKALELTPNDPFIQDSLGWVEYRSGNLTAAQAILEEAFKTRPDAEIAAHLGEVLWSLNQRSQALNTWKKGMQVNAENETLLETLKRLQVKL